MELYTIIYNSTYTSEMFTQGLFSNKELAMQAFKKRIKATIEWVKGDDCKHYLTDEMYNNRSEDMTLKEFEDYAIEDEVYTYFDGEQYTQVTLQSLGNVSHPEIDLFECMFKMYGDKLEPELLSQLEKKQKEENARAIARRV